MRIYELGFILKPDLPEQDAQAAIDAVKQALTDGGASIDKVDDWGKRRLSYRVRGFWNGHYVLIQYSVEDAKGLTREVERRLRVAENISKCKTIRIDEDLKRLKKMQNLRAKRAPKLAAKAAAVAAAAPPAQPVAPGAPQPEEPLPAADAAEPKKAPASA